MRKLLILFAAFVVAPMLVGQTRADDCYISSTCHISCPNGCAAVLTDNGCAADCVDPDGGLPNSFWSQLEAISGRLLRGQTKQVCLKGVPSRLVLRGLSGQSSCK